MQKPNKKSLFSNRSAARFPYCACALEYQPYVSIYICKYGGCKGRDSTKTTLRRHLFDRAFIQKEDKNKNQRP